MHFFGWLMIVALLGMAALEIRRYRRAQTTPGEFPYPRQRIKRRILTSLIFSSVLLLMLYWPKARPAVTLALMGLMLVGVLVGFGLLLLDLRETSQDAVTHAASLSQQASQTLKSLLENGPDKEE